MSGIKENFLGVMERIKRSAQGAGRDPEEIKLVAVSKTVETARIKEAIELCLEVAGTDPESLDFVGVQRVTVEV